MEVDLRTDTEKQRDAKHHAIISDYLAIAHDRPETAPTRIMDYIASKYGMTSMGIRKILERNNILSNNN